MDRNLERDLRGALRGARAPEELWERIEAGLSRPGPEGRRPFRWAIAAAVMTAIGASLVAFAGRTDRAELAFRQLCGHPERLDLRTGDLAEVRSWAAGQRVSVPERTPARMIAVEGAARLGQGIAVTYRAAGEWSALLIEPSAEGGPKRVMRSERNGISVFEWSSGGKRYTVATQAGERACGICHDEVPGRTV